MFKNFKNAYYKFPQPSLMSSDCFLMVTSRLKNLKVFVLEQYKWRKCVTLNVCEAVTNTCFVFLLDKQPKQLISYQNCIIIASTLMIPTRVVFIIRIPSVKMEMAWVSLATCNSGKQKEDVMFDHQDTRCNSWNPIYLSKRLVNRRLKTNLCRVTSRKCIGMVLIWICHWTTEEKKWIQRVNFQGIVGNWI